MQFDLIWQYGLVKMEPNKSKYKTTYWKLNKYDYEKLPIPPILNFNYVTKSIYYSRLSKTYNM